MTDTVKPINPKPPKHQVRDFAALMRSANARVTGNRTPTYVFQNKIFYEVDRDGN